MRFLSGRPKHKRRYPPAITTASTAENALTPITMNKALQLTAVRTAIRAPRTIMALSELGREAARGIIRSSTSDFSILTQVGFG